MITGLAYHKNVLYIISMEEIRSKLIKGGRKSSASLTGRSMSLDDELDIIFKPMIDEFNWIISSTIQSRFGGFRFIPRIGSDGKVRIMLAEDSWHKKFGEDFKNSARIFNIELEHDQWGGFYTLLPGDKDEENPLFNGRLWVKRVHSVWKQRGNSYSKR